MSRPDEEDLAELRPTAQEEAGDWARDAAVARAEVATVSESGRALDIGDAAPVYTRVERGHHVERLVRIGTAHIVPDGALVIHLDALPVNGRVEIHPRDEVRS